MGHQVLQLADGLLVEVLLPIVVLLLLQQIQVVLVEAVREKVLYLRGLLIQEQPIQGAVLAVVADLTEDQVVGQE
jgi:hypothetical protein